ncbi:MAG: cytochrome C oxidase subunit IV family protein [Gammaproteobacteria bacterium]
MSGLLRQPVTVVWALLVAATLTVYTLAESAAGGRFATVAIVLIAAFKIRLVFQWFMELRSGAMPWRLVADCWIGVVTLIIAGGVLLAPGT